MNTALWEEQHPSEQFANEGRSFRDQHGALAYSLSRQKRNLFRMSKRRERRAPDLRFQGFVALKANRDALAFALEVFHPMFEPRWDRTRSPRRRRERNARAVADPRQFDSGTSSEVWCLEPGVFFRVFGVFRG